MKKEVVQEVVSRCGWTGEDALMIEYHDTEWGIAVHDDRKHFEFIVLDSFQAGLSWKTILHKRENFRKAFAGFDPEIVAKFGEKEIERLVIDAGIIRNRAKIVATIGNAKAFLNIKDEFGSFDKYIWQFTAHKTIQNRWKTMKDIPAATPEAESMSKDLKKRGFRFAGPVICYAYMQAAGMVNDHLVGCFRYKDVMKK